MFSLHLKCFVDRSEQEMDVKVKKELHSRGRYYYCAGNPPSIT